MGDEDDITLGDRSKDMIITGGWKPSRPCPATCRGKVLKYPLRDTDRTAG